MDFAGMKRWDLQALCKQHGLPGGGTNAALVARLAACSALQGPAADVGEEVEVAARKGCLKRPAGGNDLGGAKKAVTFALEQSRGRRRRSQVTGLPAVVAADAPPAGSSEAFGASADGDSVAAEVGAAAPVPVRRSRRNSVGQRKHAEAVGASADGDSVAAEVGVPAPVPLRRSRRNSVSLGDVEAVQEQAVSVDRKRKRKSQEEDEETAVRALAEVLRRVTRRSSLFGAALVSPLAVEKKRGWGKAADGKNELCADDQVAEAQDFAVVAKVEAPVRVTRSRAIAATVTEPIVVEKKRRRTTEYEQPEVEVPTVLVVPRNDAPVTRALRNRVVQVNNSVVEKSHVGQELENKRLPSRPATRRNQQLASSMEEEGQEQAAAPSKCPPSRRTGRKNNEASIAVADSETNKSGSVRTETSNAKCEDVEKQAIAKEPVRRSTRKSFGPTMLEKGGKDLIAEKGPRPEAHVARAKRKSVVLIENMQDVSEGFQNAKDKDVVKQTAVTKPVRRSTRKSVVSVTLEERGKDLIAEKSPEAHVRTMKWRSVVPVNDSKGGNNGTQNARGVDAAKQLTVKEPVRRSTRKSFASRMLGNSENDLVATKKPEALDKGSVRKSVLPNDMINKENQNHIIMARNEGEGGDGEKQLKVEGPVRLSRRPVATIVSEKDNKGLHEETKSEIPMNRSTRKCFASNAAEKGDMDHTEMVGREPSGVGSQNLKSRGEITEYDGVVATSEIELQVEVSVENSPYHSTHKSSNPKLSDDNKTHSGMTKYISCEKPSEEVLKHRKRRKSSVEISSVDNDSYNLVDVEGQKFRNQSNAHTPNEIDSKGTNYEMTTSKGGSTKRRTTVPEEVMSVEAKYEDMVIREAIRDTVTHGNESTSRMEEIRQYNATGEECIVQTIHNVTSGSELADAQNPEIYPSHGRESSDQSKQTQEDYAIQTDDGPLSETRIEELDRSSSITEVLLHNCTVSEDKKLRDGGEVNFGDKSIQIVNASSDEVGLETSNTSAVLIVDAEAPMVESTTTVNAETNQLDAEAAQTVLSCCDGITARQGVSTDASESVPPISGSKQESHSAEQSIQDADMGKCINKSIEGNPLSLNSRSDGADTDSNLPTLDAAKGSSSDRSRSSFGLDFLFAEEHKESSSRNDTSTGVEVDYGSKPSACLTPSFCMRLDCGVECENVQPLGYNADKTLDVGHSVAHEEFIAAEMSSNEHVTVECDLKTKSNYEAVGLYMESNCTLAENNTRLAAKSCDDEHVVIQVQQDAVHEASESVPPISGGKQESHSAEQSIRDADMGKCISKSIEGNPLSPNPHSDGADTDSILPTLDAAKGSSSDRNHSSIGLDFLFAEEHKESSSRNGTSTGVEVDYGSKPSACLTPSFCMRPDCGVECENVQPLGYDADKTLDVGHSSAQEEFIAAEMSNNEHVTVECDLETKSNYEAVGLYMESNCTLAENNTRIVAKSFDDEQAVIQVQQDAVQEAPECEHEYRLPEEAELHSIANKRCSPSAEQLPLGLQSLFSQESHDSMEHGALASAISHTESGVDQLKVCHVKCTVEATTVSQPISHLDTHLATGTDEVEEVSREELVSSSLSGFLVDGNHRKEVTNSAEPTCKSDGNRNMLHSEDLKSSCEKSHVNMPVDGDCGISGTVLSCSLQAPDTDNDDVRLDSNVAQLDSGSNPSYLESTDFVDGLILRSNMEVSHQGHNNRCNGDSTEEQVASKPCAYDTTESINVNYIESEMDLLPAEQRSELQDRQLNSVLESAKVVESSPISNKDVRDILENESVDIVYEKFLFGDKSDSRVNTTNNSVGICLSDPRELLMDLQSSSEETIEGRDSHDNIAFLNTEREADESTLCEVENLDDTAVSSEPALYPGRSQDFSIDKGKQGCMFGLDKKLLEGCYLDSCQKQDAPDVLCVSQCPEESTDCQDESVLGPGTSYSSGKTCTNESINKQWTSHILALDCGVPETASIARSRRVTGMVSAAGTSELPDEQLNTKLEGPQIQEHNSVIGKDTRSLFDAELAGKSKASNLPQDAQWNPSSEHNLPTDLSAPRSPEKSTTSQNDNVSGSVEPHDSAF